jgi:hypothetical protein
MSRVHATWRRQRPLIAAAVLGLCGVAGLGTSSAQNEIYSWKDERGVVHFSDSQVPPEYAGKTEIHTAVKSTLTTGRAERPRNVPLTSVDGKRMVRAVLEGTFTSREVTMVVDTGAQFTMIDEDLADALGVRFVKEAGIVGVTGMSRGWVGRLRGLRVGDYHVLDWPVMVGPMSGLVLLGSDVLDYLRLTVGPDSLDSR